MTDKTIMLGMFQAMGLGGAWRLPGNTSTEFLDLDHWITMAMRLDEAGVDFLFFADDYAYPIMNGQVIDVAIKEALLFPKADPVTLLSALAAVTTKLGLVVTSSTTIEKPQALAKRFATLDHLSKGRIGWNVVTGAGQNSSAKLFGEKMIPHDERYALAEDHLQLAMKLWQGSWEDGALKVDKENNVYADPSMVHEIEHDGPYFQAHGLLTVPPSPQRTPVLFQAGTSTKGRDLASRYAEAVFLAAEPDMMAEQIADLRARAVSHGRAPDAIKFLIAGTFITAETEEEALALRERMIGFNTLEGAAAAYAFFTGLDLLSMELDKPLSTVKTEQGRTNVERFAGENGKPAPTVREILEEFRRNGVMGQPFIGTPAQVVDQAKAVIAQTGADGFLVQPGPDGTYDDFIDLLMPVMRERGLIAPPASAGTTLRERIFGAGQKRLPHDHPGAQYLAGAEVLTG
ncbi:NtaA/DmoA family FMN-dependent monooxygenase [Subtercola frigoramans]|uniref:FMN-dependent oxidoreductase (Nitrilotriacetate monooxygenase family) n=1 Tax=Subtercola frigoramans TaxID=120298 RepID=A0ABS2L7S2_9MICO|nr:NtaA/DmoA family FMN-dependent monooxygenase [Subtercola frigoramans]MBM7473064.1 FMN-dependent oxidoreductase (nitrilotriacetate monooxygenase family) [Subtercola frigoramans]